MTHSLYRHAQYIPSPHADDRPDEQDISLIVIHNISLPPGEYGNAYIETFFQGQLDEASHPYFAEIVDLKVSAHALIKRNGDVVQFVPFEQRAWHAGVSSFQGRARCNDFSIGIELEGTDDDRFSDEQYLSLCALTTDLMQCYTGITLGRIVGHCDIAPGRKTDPGPLFDWARYRQSLVVK